MHAEAEPQTFRFSGHALRRAFMEQVHPGDVLTALEDEHRTRRLDDGGVEHFVRLGDETFRVVTSAARSAVILTLYRVIRNARVRADLKALSRRTKQMQG